MLHESRHPIWLTRMVFVGLSVLVLSVGGLHHWRHQVSEPLSRQAAFAGYAAKANPAVASQPMTLRELSRQDIPMPADTPAAHASFLLADKGGGLRAFWFAGSRESGEDVQIWTSTFSPDFNHAPSAKPSAAGVWSQPRVAVNRHEAYRALGSWNPAHSIRRLGNPVAWIDRQGNTHLYVVATTWLGGWAASRILHLRQEAGAAARSGSVARDDAPFQPIGFLPLSPLFNVSHLVRGAPIPMQDGGALLPAYFEIGIKYPVAIRLNDHGDLMPTRHAVVRMAGNLASLQPTLAVMSSDQAIAYLRDNSDDKKLRFVQTQDAGRHWSDIPSSAGAVGDAGADWVINPDSSVAALRLGEGAGAQTLLIHNPQTSGRHRLVIEASADGLRGFKRLATLEYEPEKLDGVPFNEYSYPSAVRVGDQLHVSYTYQKRFIRHVVLAIEARDSRAARP